MWTCDKCGRQFKNTNQSHYRGTKPKTVEEYILAKDEDMWHIWDFDRGLKERWNHCIGVKSKGD